MSKTVKRLFFLDFSTKSFFYKHTAKDIDCKSISSFKVSVKNQFACLLFNDFYTN